MIEVEERAGARETTEERTMSADPDGDAAHGSNVSTGLPCDGCLGTKDCWICLGTGAYDGAGGIRICRSCGGSRVCRYCRETSSPLRRATGRFGPLAAPEEHDS